MLVDLQYGLLEAGQEHETRAREIDPDRDKDSDTDDHEVAGTRDRA